MRYKKIYGDLEDYSHELKVAKANQAFFRISTDQAEIEGVRPEKLPDGTVNNNAKVRGLRFVSTITLTALGVCNPDPDRPGVVPERPKYDTQLVFGAAIAQKDCFIGEDKAEFDRLVDVNWKAVLNEVKKQWGGAFFEGEVSLTE
jgi:hypothetical protein